MDIDRFLEQDKMDWIRLWNLADDWSQKNNRPDIPEANWRDIMSNDNRLQAFCLREGVYKKVVGYTLFHFNVCIKTGGDECFIRDLFVDPIFRKQGGGRKLVEAIIQASQEYGAGRIFWIANTQRPESIEFYRRISVEQKGWAVFVKWLN